MLSYKNWKTFNENMMPSFNLGISQPQSMGIMSNSPTTQEMGDETSADTSGQTTDGQSDVAPESGSEETSGDNVEKVLSILKDDELSNKEKAEKIAAMMDGNSESETPEGEAPEGEAPEGEGEDTGADANAPAADTTNQQPTAESYMHGYMHGDDDDDMDDDDMDDDDMDDDDMDDEDMDDEDMDDDDDMDDEDMDDEDMDDEDMDDEDMDDEDMDDEDMDDEDMDDEDMDDEDMDDEDMDDEDMDDEDMDDEDMDDEDMDDEDMDDEDMDDEDMDDEDDEEFDEKLKEHKEWLKTVKYDDSFFFEAEDQDNIDEDDEDDEVHPEQKSVLKKKIKKVYDKLENKNWKIPEDNDFKLNFQNKKELTKELIGLSIFTLKEILAYFNSQNDEKNQEAKKARALARANKPKRELTSVEIKAAKEKADKKRKSNSLKNKIRKDYDKLKKVRYVFPLNPTDSYFGQPGFNFDTKEDLNAYLRSENDLDDLTRINRLHLYLSSHLDHWNMFGPWGGHANKHLHQSGFVIGADNSNTEDKSGKMTDHDKLYQSYKWAIGGKPIVPFDKTKESDVVRHDSEIAKIFSPDEQPEEVVNNKRRLRTIYYIRREELELARGRSFNYIELEKLKNTYEITDKLTYLLELYNDHMKETNQKDYGYNWHEPPEAVIRSYSKAGGASGRVQNFSPPKGKNQSTDMTANKHMGKIAVLERTIRKCYVCNEKHYKTDMLEVRPDGQPVRYVCPDCQKANRRATHDPTVGYSPFNARSVDVDITHEKPNITPKTKTKTKTKTSLTDKFLNKSSNEEVNWWNSIHSMLGHDSNEKHSDGLTNLPEVIKPSAGQVGFAPQGRIGWFQ